MSIPDSIPGSETAGVNRPGVAAWENADGTVTSMVTTSSGDHFIRIYDSWEQAEQEAPRELIPGPDMAGINKPGTAIWQNSDGSVTIMDTSISGDHDIHIYESQTQAAEARPDLADLADPVEPDRGSIAIYDETGNRLDEDGNVIEGSGTTGDDDSGTSEDDEGDDGTSGAGEAGEDDETSGAGEDEGTSGAGEDEGSDTSGDQDTSEDQDTSDTDTSNTDTSEDGDATDSDSGTGHDDPAGDDSSGDSGTANDDIAGHVGGGDPAQEGEPEGLVPYPYQGKEVHDPLDNAWDPAPDSFGESSFGSQSPTLKPPVAVADPVEGAEPEVLAPYPYQGDEVHDPLNNAWDPAPDSFSENNFGSSSLEYEPASSDMGAAQSDYDTDIGM